MPRYDYQCKECGHQFEVRQSYASEPVANCLVCNSEARRVIHSVPVVFKGSGFYVNDYGKGKGSTTSSPETKSSESGDKAATDADSKTDSAADSKSDSKAESKLKKEPTSAKSE